MRARRKLAIAAASVLFLASIVLVTLSIQPMKGDYYDCGTIFASADTWWYDVTRAPDGDFVGQKPDATHQACESAHGRRLVILSLVAALAAAAAGTAVVSWRRSRTPRG